MTQHAHQQNEAMNTQIKTIAQIGLISSLLSEINKSLFESNEAIAEITSEHFCNKEGFELIIKIQEILLATGARVMVETEADYSRIVLLASVR